MSNIIYKIGEDCKTNLDKNSRLKVCVALFSIYGYSVLRKEIEQIQEFKFLFNTPTFLKEELNKKKHKEYQMI